MARVTVEDCLENVENRFKLVMISTQRARQLERLPAPEVHLQMRMGYAERGLQ